MAGAVEGLLNVQLTVECKGTSSPTRPLFSATHRARLRSLPHYKAPRESSCARLSEGRRRDLLVDNPLRRATPYSLAMDLNLPTPPDGADPYAFYGDLLHRWTMLSPTDPAGFRARLAVLLFLCAFLGLSSAVNFVVHALGYYSKGRRLWLFKTVKRDSGTHVPSASCWLAVVDPFPLPHSHIISNHFLLATLGGLALFVILLGNTLTLWRAVVSPGGGTSQEYLAKWSFALWPVAYLVAWTLRCACLFSGACATSQSLTPAPISQLGDVSELPPGRGWHSTSFRPQLEGHARLARERPLHWRRDRDGRGSHGARLRIPGSP